MPLSNVFISSRMEELASERRSAFDAIYLYGLIPLAFETEPTGQSEKDMIDSLVDSSDIFVGIYYETIGKQQEMLNNLEPIVYEMYRFLFRHSSNRIKELAVRNKVFDVKSKLDWLLSNQESIEALRKSISGGELNDVLAGRVRIFQMTHNYDAPMSRDLATFLIPFHQAAVSNSHKQHRFISSFQACKEEVSGPVVPGAENCERYLTARFQLFSLINDMLEVAEANGFEPPNRDEYDRDGTRYFGWRVSSKDNPGILFIVLRAIFSQRFNASMVCSGDPPVNECAGGQIVVDVIARPFLNSACDESSLLRRTNAITDELQGKLDGDCSIKGYSVSDWDSHRVSEYRNVEHEDDRRFYYIVETADVPGQVLGIAQRVLFYQANINLLFFDSRSDYLLRTAGRKGDMATMLLAVSPSSCDSLFQKPMHRARFITEIRQGLGVLNVRELRTKEDFFNRLEESNKRITTQQQKIVLER